MLKADAQSASGQATSRWWILLAVVIGMALATALATGRLINGWDNPVVADAELWVLDDAALWLVLATPSLLALLGRARPSLLLPAGVLSLLFGLSPLILTLPLLLPGAIYLVAFARSGVRMERRTLIGVVGAIVLGIFPMTWLLLGPEQTVCWSRTTEDNATVYTEERQLGSSGSGSLGPLGPGEATSAGCDGGVVGPWVSGPMLASSAAALGAGALAAREDGPR